MDCTYLYHENIHKEFFLSSIFLYAAKQSLKKNQVTTTTSLLIGALVLGIAFIYSQIQGFNQIIDSGYNFTGPTSNITMSYIYIIAVVHIIHVLAGIICLIVVIINQLNKNDSSFSSDHFLISIVNLFLR